MLEISSKTNLLEQKSYKYTLQDVAEPNLHRDVYSYGTIPKVAFNHRRVPMNMPEEIWITDTSLRDGQQSVEPYSVDQIVNIYKLLNKLGGPYGIIRQTEFFIYSKKDREAIEKCMELDYKFPEITSWIRASKEDLCWCFFFILKEMVLSVRIQRPPFAAFIHPEIQGGTIVFRLHLRTAVQAGTGCDSCVSGALSGHDHFQIVDRNPFRFPHQEIRAQVFVAFYLCPLEQAFSRFLRQELPDCFLVHELPQKKLNRSGTAAFGCSGSGFAFGASAGRP